MFEDKETRAVKHLDIRLPENGDGASNATIRPERRALSHLNRRARRVGKSDGARQTPAAAVG